MNAVQSPFCLKLLHTSKLYCRTRDTSKLDLSLTELQSFTCQGVSFSCWLNACCDREFTPYVLHNSYLAETHIKGLPIQAKLRLQLLPTLHQLKGIYISYDRCYLFMEQGHWKLVWQIEANTMGVLTVVHILISFAACAEAISRADFPPGFVFGTASSAYQVGYGQKGKKSIPAGMLLVGCLILVNVLPVRRRCQWGPARTFNLGYPYKKTWCSNEDLFQCSSKTLPCLVL